MRDARGTVILCDQLYPSIGGKWIIAGTYSTWKVRPGARHLELPPLNVYIRFQVQQAGEFAGELLLMQRSLPANDPPLLRQEFRVRIGDPLSPYEMGCVLPAFQVRCPDEAPQQQTGPIGVHLLLWLRIAGEDVASCPLNVLFQPEPGHDRGEGPAA